MYQKKISPFCRIVSALFLLTLVFLLCLGGVSAGAKSSSSAGSKLVCTDGLGRTVSNFEDVGAKKEDKFVGLFYWLWHAGHSQGNVTKNVAEILANHPGIERDWSSGWWGSANPYFWDEPLFGYYDGMDPWVFRKHAELLAAADVDVIIFDCTNGTELFLKAFRLLADAFMEAREAGVDTPQVAFMLPFWSKDQNLEDLHTLWSEIYKPGEYQDLWFYWKGKPLVLGLSSALDPLGDLDNKIKDFFTFRSVQASYYVEQMEDEQWGWLARYPQNVFKVNGKIEEISVGAAQNYSDEFGLTAMNAGDQVHGRTWSTQNGGRDTSENAILKGANFAEQFEYAIEQDPEFIFITGWNEWVAGRYTEWENIKNAFPDEFNPEYSRDIEPSAGVLKDYYYYQMVDYIRKFKGTEPMEAVSAKASINIHGDTAQWEKIAPFYEAPAGNTKHRNGKGYNRLSYVNNTGRNDITGAKIAYDAENVYFMVQTAEKLTPYTDPNWMRLYLDVDETQAENWEYYDYIINRQNPDDSGALLERSTGGWNWETVGRVDFAVQENVLTLSVPREMLGIKDGAFELRFKWVDNSQNDGDIMDFYSNGDAAPLGRFQYYFDSDWEGAPGNWFSEHLVLVLILGIVVLLLAAGVVFLLIRNKNKKKKESAIA